jgi:DNA-binding NtrC family response regulator
MRGTLLIVEDEKNTREGLAETFVQTFDVFTAGCADDAFRLLNEKKFDVVLTDLRMGAESGMSVLDRALKLPHRPACVVMTAYGNVETAVEAMKRGAYDFVGKPLHLNKLEILLRRAMKDRAPKEENGDLHKKLSDRRRLEGILGGDEHFQSILRQVEQVAPTKTTVLILGETGTGKELIARQLHQKSRRGPFVAVHCAALASTLLESELWGHEKGAFTGAVGRRIGRFEAADKGTLFLDEIGEIDSTLQIKLLRFLETRSIERIGSTQSIQLDVRLICATNRNLEALVADGKFREDLLYRLNVVVIRLPPLRERRSDIHILLTHYLKLFGDENGLPMVSLSDEAERVLTDYRWPGNVRELRNFAENIAVMKSGRRVGVADLDRRFFDSDSKDPASIEENEKRLIHETLVKAGNNKTRAAAILGIDRRTLHRKLKQWRL